MVSGLFFGLSFGAAGSGAALLGALADATNIEFVYRLCAFLPALGVTAALLPDVRGCEASEIGDPVVPTDSPTSGPLWSDPDTGS